MASYENANAKAGRLFRASEEDLKKKRPLLNGPIVIDGILLYAGVYLKKGAEGKSDHYANFLLAVMGREQARSPFSVTGPLSEVFCLGCIAQRLNRGFDFDPAKKRVIGDEVAQRLLKGASGTPRKGWEEFYRV